MIVYVSCYLIELLSEEALTKWIKERKDGEVRDEDDPGLIEDIIALFNNSEVQAFVQWLAEADDEDDDSDDDGDDDDESDEDEDD